jgi:surface protein
MVVLRSKEILTKFKILLVLIFWSTNLYADDRTLLPVFDPFITTWQTSGATNLVTIPLTGAGYDFTIDWGDGIPTEIKTGAPGNISHTYSSSGIKTVRITPNILTGFPRIYVNNYALRSNLLTVESWGSGKWGADLSSAFFGANNLEVNATDVPNFSVTTSFSSMFQSCTSLTGANGFANWTLNTTALVSFASMFNGATKFNGNISNWDVSKVTNTSLMFYQANSFNQNLNSWDVSSVTNAGQMFHEAKAFNGDISSWRFTTDLTKIISMPSIFRDASSFNQDISGWNVERVNQMQRMFQGTPFNQDISEWDISNVTNLQLFLSGGKLSRANYDKILIDWSTLDPGETKIPVNLNVDFGSSKYSNDPTVLTARDTELRGSKTWIITDGGMDSDFVLPIITGNVLASENTSISITFSEGVYKTSLGSGTLEISDFLFSLSGGAATLNTTTPNSISTLNNLTFVLGIDISGTPNGAEVLTVTPIPNAIFDLSGNIAATSQDNNTVLLNDLSPPIISMPSGDAVSIKENSTAVFTFTASESVTWSLGTAVDAALLNIDSNGKLAFNTAPDFENPISTSSSNTYVVAIIATDAASNTDTKTLTITVLDIPNTIFGTFESITKQYFAGPHTIVSPTTNNSNPIVYTSDNTAVATISGSTITFTGIGTATITATQEADVNYEGGSVSTLLTVLGKDLVTKFGGVSSTDVNYVDANGKVGGGFGVDKYGKITQFNYDIITAGLVMHLDAGNTSSYPGSGTTWKDLSGNGNNGTLVSGVGYNGDNKGSLVFDGINDYVDLGGSLSLKPVNSITVSIWIMFNSLTSNTRAVSDWHQSIIADRWIFYIRNSTTIEWYLKAGSEGGVSYSPVLLNTWYNFTGTFNGTSQIFYVNGQLHNSRSQVGTLDSSSIANPIRIGGQVSAGGYHNGNISLTSIYNRALTAQEVLQNFNATKGRYGL